LKKQQVTLPVSLLLLICGFVSNALALGPSQVLPLIENGIAKKPQIVLSTEKGPGCTVLFDLPALIQEITHEGGKTYHRLTIEGGGLVGDIGEAGIPTFGGMLELPAGTMAEPSILVLESQVFSQMAIMPVQSPDAGEFVIGPSYFDSKEYASGPQVIIGEPALLFGRRVVPFVIEPVSYDPTTETVTVASRLEIEFSFTGQSDKNNPQHSAEELPASFNNFFNEQVVNAVQSTAEKSINQDELGTYLVICPDIAQVEDELQPLLDWRRRQGYSVMLTDMSEAGTTNTDIRDYIDSVYQTVTPLLEFVVLVGDVDGDIALPTWYETMSGYLGEGDHFYSLLNGRDSLSDVFIGRLSCRNTSELSTIVSKIVSYETEPPVDEDPSWFSRATLVGDPASSGSTTILSNQWLKSQIQDIGFAQVDTIWGGNFPGLMRQGINQGVSIFGYRGYYGMSGFSESSIGALTNGGKLPFAVFPTCDSGSWAAVTSARNERFLTNPNGGAIGAIGLATIGTHTRYNNCLYYGIWETAVNGNDHRLGVAQAGGKIEMFNQYGAHENSNVFIWSVWSSLIGDPATDLWLALPGELTVDHPLDLPVNANAVTVTVASEGQPVADAFVALYKEGEISATVRSNSNGEAIIPLDYHTSGTLLVTVWGHNLLPYQGSISLGTVDVFVNLNQADIDDDSEGGSIGNGDGVANPGETLSVKCYLQNLGTDVAGAVSVVVTSNDPLVTITNGNIFYGDIAGGETVGAKDEFLMELSPLAPNGHTLELKMDVSSADGNWVSLLNIPVAAAILARNNYNWSEGTNLYPGGDGTITLTLNNTSEMTANGLVAELSTTSPWITISQPNASYPDIPAGGQATNSSA